MGSSDDIHVFIWTRAIGVVNEMFLDLMEIDLVGERVLVEYWSCSAFNELFIGLRVRDVCHHDEIVFWEGCEEFLGLVDCCEDLGRVDEVCKGLQVVFVCEEGGSEG